MEKIELWSIIYYYFTFHTQKKKKKKKIIYGPPKDKFLAPPLLAGNKNESEIGNGATRRCDQRDATRGSWVRRSWVVGSLFVGSPFVGSWVRCSLVRRSWVRRSLVDDLAGGATISTFWVRNLSLSLFARVLSLSLFLSLQIFRNDLKVKFWLKIFSGSKALILRSTKILFRKIHFPDATKHPHFRKKQTQP